MIINDDKRLKIIQKDQKLSGMVKTYHWAPNSMFWIHEALQQMLFVRKLHTMFVKVLGANNQN